MDVLSDTVAALRIGRAGFGVTVRHAPWGREYGTYPGLGFHVVLRGGCWLRTDDAEPIPLGVGDVVLLHSKGGHGLSDTPDSPLLEVASPGEPAVVPGPGAPTALLCGGYEFDADWSHPLLDELPQVVHVPARMGRHPRLRATVDLLSAELDAELPGRDGMMPSLLDAMLIYILRAWYDSRTEAGAEAGWASAFNDPAISAALRALHAEPARQWTVDEIGAVANLSRASISRRFARLVGEAPLSYLTRWRMILAAGQLRGTDAPLATIARRVGYGSEYAFAKAFKRIHGTSPGQYRDRAATHTEG